MVKKITKLLFLAAVGFYPNFASAGILDGLINTRPEGTPQAAAAVDALLRNIRLFALGAVGAVAAVMIVYSAFLYFTAGGNEEKLKKAKDTLIWAIAGISLVVAAEILIRIFAAIFGANVMDVYTT